MSTDERLLEDPKNLAGFDGEVLYLFARQCAQEAYQKIIAPVRATQAGLYFETGDEGARLVALEELCAAFRARQDAGMRRDSAESCARDACYYATVRHPGLSPADAAWYAADGLATGLSKLLELDPSAERQTRLAIKARLARQLESLA